MRSALLEEMGVSGVDREFFARVKRDTEEVPCQTEENHLVRFDRAKGGMHVLCLQWEKGR